MPVPFALRLAQLFASVAALTLAHTGCSAPNPDESSAPVASSSEATLGSEAWRRLPAAERARRIQALQASAGPAFAVRETKPGVFSAWHAEMGLRTTFESGRVSLTPGSEADANATPFELAATAWGCAGAMLLALIFFEDRDLA